MILVSSDRTRLIRLKNGCAYNVIGGTCCVNMDSMVGFGLLMHFCQTKHLRCIFVFVCYEPFMYTLVDEDVKRRCRHCCHVIYCCVFLTDFT